MSYETLKQFSINLKNLTVKYSYSSNNLRDWRDRLVVEKVEKTFESKKELEDYLLGLVSGVIDGVTKLPRSLPMYKRIQWLSDNDLIENDMAKDTEEVRKVLTGEKKVQPKQYIMVTDLGATLRKRQYGVTLYPEWKKVSPTTLYKSDLKEIEENFADFIKQHEIKVVEVV